MRFLLAVFVLGICCATAAADKPEKGETVGKEKEKPVSFWMEKKLEYTQEMLRGLATGELEMVADKAEQMRLLSKVEGWIRKGQPGYKAQLQVFELANSEILRNARSGNLDGAAMAFQQLTISCVSCHKMIRNVD